MLPVRSRTVYTLNDGLGLREMVNDPRFGEIEVLDLSADLGEPQALEPAIQARAARNAAGRHAGKEPGVMPALHRLDAAPGKLRLFCEVPEGIRLSQLLANVESGVDELTEPEFLSLTLSVVAAVAALHARSPGAAHGAISPAHVILAHAGGCVLTDGLFGGVFETLRRNRAQFWSEFGLALPAAASVHRFDQRTDLTQLGAVVLALALRRPLRSDEYPRAIDELVAEATPDSAGSHAAALRGWLQQALQLQSRTLFPSAAAAREAFAAIVAASGLARSRREARAFSFPGRPVTMAAARCGTPR